jgi:hypothetical protein
VRAGTRRTVQAMHGGTAGCRGAQVVQAFVRQAMGYVDQAPDKETRVALIEALQTVTEGKVGAPVRMHAGLVMLAHCGHMDWHVHTVAPAHVPVGPGRGGRSCMCVHVMHLQPVRSACSARTYVERMQR